MPDEPPAVCWLTGPPCAGKSASAWELFASALAGRPRAFFDVDQLGMCYPSPEDPTARAALRAQAAAGASHHHLAGGAGVVVVSGVLDAGAEALVRDALDGVAVRFCRLRADEAVLRARLEQRYGDDDVERALADARRWDASDLPPVDTTALAVEEAARSVLDLLGPVAARPSVSPLHDGDDDDDDGDDGGDDGGRVVLLCGAPGVGTSTAGFGLAARSWAAGETCAYLDARQLGFSAGLERCPGPVSTAALLGRLWRTYRAAGARVLVVRAAVDAPSDVAALRRALAWTPLLAVRLTAGGGALRERVAARVRGEGANLAGDELRGLDEPAQRRVVEDSLRRQAEAAQAGVGDVVVGTDGLTAADVVDRLERLAALVVAS